MRQCPPHFPPLFFFRCPVGVLPRAKISPLRGGDAFAGQTPTRSFKDIMAEQALAKEDKVISSLIVSVVLFYDVDEEYLRFMCKRVINWC